MELALAVFVFLYYSQVAVRSLKFETTDSFSSVLFNWTGFCNDTYLLSCVASSSGPGAVTSQFIPLEASPSNCFFIIFGFSASTTYNCSLSSNGEFLEFVTVKTLSEVPSEPLNLQVYDITWSSAELDWDPPAVNWDRVAGYNIYTSAGTFLNTTTSTYITLHLLSSNSYVIHVAAVYYNSSIHASANGPHAVISFSTPNNVPSAPRYLLALTAAATSTSCFLIWNQPASNCHLVRSYRIKFGSQTKNVGLKYFYNFTSLRTGTRYTFSVSAFYDNTNTSESKSVTCTPTKPVPSRPRNLMVHAPAATSSSCFLTWNQPTSNSHFVTGYQIRFNSQTRNVGLVYFYNFTGLSTGTQYTFTVSANYDNTNTSESNSVTCKPVNLLNQQAPKQPILQTVATSSRQQETATIIWSTTSSSSSSINRTASQFDISFYPIFSGSASIGRKTVAGNLRNTTITGLKPNSSYQVSLLARNCAGSSRAASGIIPPYLPNYLSIATDNEKNVMQLLLILNGNTNCSMWQNDLKQSELANALFDRLHLICPSCEDFLPRSNYLNSYTTHCSGRSDLVLFQAKVKASASCGDCNFNTLLEYLVSLSFAYILAEGSILVIVSSCPLYVSSLRNTNCLMSHSSSSGSVAGGTIGGLIAGIVLASVVAIVTVLVFIFYKRRRQYLMDIDLTPHPTAHTHHKKSISKKGTEKEDDYEDIPMFGAGPVKMTSYDEDDSEDLSQLNIPKALSISGEYEIPDYKPQSTPNNDSAIKKKTKSKYTISKKGSGLMVAAESIGSSKTNLISTQVNSDPKKASKSMKTEKKDEKENKMPSTQAYAYSVLSNVEITQQHPTASEFENVPLKQVKGKKVTGATTTSGGAGEVEKA